MIRMRNGARVALIRGKKKAVKAALAFRGATRACVIQASASGVRKMIVATRVCKLVSYARCVAKEISRCRVLIMRARKTF